MYRLWSIYGVFILIISEDSNFDTTYQSVIQRKYEKLKNAKGPKIIIIGGSNAGFGIDSIFLEEETGYTVVNMGLHAGFGRLFVTEIAKRYVSEGDIVLLAYEYGIYNSDFDALGDLNLIMSGIDDKIEMYKEIPLKNQFELFGNVLKFAEYKAKNNKEIQGVYSSSSFDEFGNMILERDNCVISDYQNNIDAYGYVSETVLLADNDNLEYLNELREYVERKGASVYFTSAVLLKEAYQGTEQGLIEYAKEIERRTGIKYISNPNKYLFDREYMFDTIYHCNSEGEKRRTELLLKDLQENDII